MCPNLIKENWRMSTCNRLDLQTLGSQPITVVPEHVCPKIILKIKNVKIRKLWRKKNKNRTYISFCDILLFLIHLRSFLLMFWLKNKNWEIQFLERRTFFSQKNKYSFARWWTCYWVTVCPNISPITDSCVWGTLNLPYDLSGEGVYDRVRVGARDLQPTCNPKKKLDIFLN